MEREAENCHQIEIPHMDLVLVLAPPLGMFNMSNHAGHHHLIHSRFVSDKPL